MKTFKSVFPIVAAFILVSCATAPTFELEDQNDFNPSDIAGNWVCSFEQIKKTNGNTMITSSEFQEYFGETGEYVSSGTTHFKINDAELGSTVTYVEGRWIANQTEIMTEGDRAKVIVTPGSSELLKKNAQTPNSISALKKATKEKHEFSDGYWIRTSTKSSEQTMCLSWNDWEKQCRESGDNECGVLLNEEMRKQANDRFFSDS